MTVTLPNEVRNNQLLIAQPRSIGSDADADSVEDEYAVGASEKDDPTQASALRRIQL